jgi:predicted RNase H-like HicB family nuclease
MRVFFCYSVDMSKNTLQSGSVRVIIFKDKKDWVGAVLELNIVETGDDPQTLLLFLEEAIQGYVHVIAKECLDERLLNQKPNPEYEKMWNDFTLRRHTKSIPSIYCANTFSLRVPVL